MHIVMVELDNNSPSVLENKTGVWYACIIPFNSQYRIFIYQQGCIKLIKSGSKDNYNAIKDFSLK